MNTRQQKQLARKAFLAGAANGGDSSPADFDHDDIQRSISLDFESWWQAELKCRRSSIKQPRAMSARVRTTTKEMNQWLLL